MADIMLPYNGATRAVLATGSDLDSVTNPGIYVLSSGNTYTNSPVSLGMLEVIRSSTSSSYYTQRVASYDEGNWERFKKGSTGWSSWSRKLEATIESPTYSNGILHYAYNVAPLGTTIVSPRNMNANELPESSFIYSTAIINKRGATAISVTLINDNNYGSMAVNTYSSGSNSWVGWKMCGGVYFNTTSSFWNAVANLDIGFPMNFGMAGSPANSIFGTGSSSASGSVTLLSTTVAMGSIVVNNNEAYSFWINPSAQTLTRISRLSHEIQLFSQSAATSHSFTIPNSYRGMVFTSDTSDTYAGMYILSASSTGSAHVFTVKSASNITPAESTNRITFTLAASRAMTFAFINSYGGEVSVYTS